MDPHARDRNERKQSSPEEWDTDPQLADLVATIRGSIESEAAEPSHDLRVLFSQGRPTPIRPELVDDPLLARSRRARAVAVVATGAFASKLLLGGAAAAATLGTLQVTGAVDVVHLTGLDRVPAIWESDSSGDDTPTTTPTAPSTEAPDRPTTTEAPDRPATTEPPTAADQPGNRPTIPPGQDEQPGNRPEIPPGQDDTPGNSPEVPPGQQEQPGNRPEIPPGQDEQPGNRPETPPGQDDQPGNRPDVPPGQADDGSPPGQRS